MRIATVNVNGIRASQQRGFTDWLAATDPDVVALQEVRCPLDDLPTDAFADFWLSYHAGTRAGRNGVAVLTRQPPAEIRAWGTTVLSRGHHADAPPDVHLDFTTEGLARELRPFADEGRYVEVDLADRPLTVASVYVPKGGTLREDEASARNYHRKLSFLAGFERQLGRSRRAARADGREFIVMGDLNVAHTQHDLKNWKGAHRSPGFLPEERAWFDRVLSPRTMVDVVRRLHPDQDGPWSWWSWRGQSWNADAGWRIDYHLATPGLARAATSGGTHKALSYESRMSDHAPVVVDYDW